MPDWLTGALLALFLIHLIVFVRVALRKREIYPVVLCALFAALSASFALRLWGPDMAFQGLPLWQWLRYLAWAIAAVTIPWLVVRLVRRRRAG